MFSSKNYQHIFLFVFTAKYFQIERLRNRHRQLQLEPRNKEKNRIIMQQQKTVALGKATFFECEYQDLSCLKNK